MVLMTVCGLEVKAKKMGKENMWARHGEETSASISEQETQTRVSSQLNH